MSLVCSVLIPSRARPDRLMKTIQSLHGTAQPSRFEILLRFDDDDLETLKRRHEAEEYRNVRVIVGKRQDGYARLNHFYAELADIARSPWVWIMNDDVVVKGARWEAKLAEVPTEGFIVQPEHYQLGGSLYSGCEGTAFPIVPNGIWKRFGWAVMDNPVDTRLDDLLRKENGWKTHFLDGITVVHDRDPDDILEKHRASAQK